jgi:predicted alpha/beta hydrolase family esterase
MRKAIILHGKPSEEEYYDPSRYSQSNEHWIPWLQRQLLLKDILTQTPEWPKPYAPDYAEWLKVFKQFQIDESVTLIGYSCGGGFLVRWLSENDIEVGKVILVAPSLDPERTVNGFFDFKIDPKLTSKTKGLVVFGSDNDSKSIKNSISTLFHVIKDIKYREFIGCGHFTFWGMGKREFPELLEEVLK